MSRAHVGHPILVAAALLAAGCQRDYGFETVARYEATRSHYRLSVRAAGTVRGGDDVSRQSTAAVSIAPTTTQASSIALNVALPDAPPDARTLAQQLADAGYTAASEEVDESVRAIEGALAGPKGTLMDGQTKALRVLEIRFAYR